MTWPPVLDAAISMAQDAGAHLDVLCLGIDRTQTGYYFAGATADDVRGNPRAGSGRGDASRKRPHGSGWTAPT